MMVLTTYPGNKEPIKEVIDYGDVTHFVSVVYNASHYAVLYYNIARCTMTVYDGLNYCITKQQDHILHTIKMYGLQLAGASAQFKFQSCKECDEYRRKKKIMVLEIYFKDTDTYWFVANEQSYIQDDDVHYGPIKCLKVMKIYWFLEEGSIQRFGDSEGGYPHTVMDYFNQCIIKYNEDVKMESRK
jgi:hypothetical protein